MQTLIRIHRQAIRRKKAGAYLVISMELEPGLPLTARLAAKTDKNNKTIFAWRK
ncbi:MAG: hypothetical protein ABSB60_09660 [Terracidiphilus sp.]|jgi:hypothetical protein